MKPGLGIGSALAFGSSGAAAAAPSDLYFDLVTQLLDFEGANGAQIFTDRSNNPVAFGVGAGAPALTTAQKKFGAAALNLDGVSNISTPGGAVKWQPTTQDWTNEIWARHTSADAGVSREYLHWGDHGAGVFSNVLQHLAGGGGTWDFYLRGAAVGNLEIQSAAAQAITAGAWMHICHERSGDTIRGYVDGVMKGKLTGVTDAILDNGGNPFVIGGNLVGQIDSFRQTIGVARFDNDAGFAPPTAAFPLIGRTPTQPVIVQEARAITNAASSVTFAQAPTQGNRLVAFCTHYNNANTLNSAGGWRQILNTNGAVDDGWAIAEKICGAGESATQSPFTFGASGNSIAMFEVHGAAKPSFGYLTRDQEQTTASLTKASVAAPMQNCLLIGAFFAISTGGLTPALAAVTQTSQTSGNGTATQGVPRCITNFKASPAKGASVNAQATYSGAVKQWVASLMLLPSS